MIRLLHTLFLALFFILSTSAVTAKVTITYFHNDASGTPLLATDAAGNVVWKENHKPYGERVLKQAANNNSTNKIGFAGSPFDASTGLSYMGARYYDPVIGRFMGVDPVGFQEGNVHSFNRYAYANNNPYKYVDRDGRSPVHVLAFAIGFGVDVAAQSYIKGFDKVNYTDAAISGVGAALTGGVGTVFMKQALQGSITVGTAVKNTAFVGAVAGGATSIAQDLSKGDPVKPMNAALNAGFGAIGAAGGARISGAYAKVLERLSANKDGVVRHIGDVSRSANIGDVTVPTSAGQELGKVGSDLGSSATSKKYEQ